MSTGPPQSEKYDLTSGSLGWNLFRLAAPTAAGMVLQALYNLVDAFWLGKVTAGAEVAVAAVGVSGPLINIVVMLGYGLGMGGTVLVAQHTGAGRDHEADRAAAQTMLLICALFSGLAVPMILLAPSLLGLLQAPPEALPMAVAYLRIYMLAAPLMGFLAAYQSVLRALGDTLTVVLIGAMANVVNAVLDPLFIFGLLGLPAMGVPGAALASAIAQTLAAAACLWCLKRGRAGLRVHRPDFRPHWPTISHAFSIGLPAAVASAGNSVGYALFMSMINKLGLTVVAAFTISFRVLHFFNAPMAALSSAASPIVGQALGAGRLAIARRAVGVSAALYGGVMLLPVVLLMWQGRLVARLFIPDPDTVAEMGRFFRVVPWSTYFFGVSSMFLSAFYGSGHTRPAMVVSLIRVAGVRLPAAYLLAFTLGFGSMGAYVGMVAGNVVSASLALWLFRRVRWESAVVLTAPDRQEA
jgi:putative MATE family efflux protein